MDTRGLDGTGSIASPGDAREIGALAGIPDGAARGFDPSGSGRDTVFVVRRGDQLHAFRDDCPHWPGTPLPWRRHAYLTADRAHIRCSAHGALFDPTTGLCVLGPCQGRSLERVACSVGADGRLLLHIDDKTTTETNPS